jgi:hypothetical protein
MSVKVNLYGRFGPLDDYWSPRIVTSVNDYNVKAVKVRGQFVWHQHDETTGSSTSWLANFRSICTTTTTSC